MSDIAALAETFAASASSLSRLPMPESTVTLGSVRESESQPKQSAGTHESKMESPERKGSCSSQLSKGYLRLTAAR